MNDTLEQYAQKPLGDNILAQIAQTARDVMDAQALVAEREEALKDAQRTLRTLQHETLPELMAVAGQDALTTVDGLKVAMKVDTQWRPDQTQKAFTLHWLEENGHGSVIKREVKVALGKASEEEVRDLSLKLVAMGLDPASKVDVNWMTFGALARELMARGEDVPLADMGAEITRIAKVTPVK